MDKYDLHLHTEYSIHWFWRNEAIGTPKQIVKEAIRKGLAGIAITDHNEVKGSLKAWEYAKNKNFTVITGSEIRSEKGDILALNIKENIPKGLPVEETIKRIHDMGGLAVVAHPYAGFPRRSALGYVSRSFDAVEGLNGMSTLRANKKARLVAKEMGLPITGGTDAHYWKDVGTAFTLCEGDVLEAIRKGKTGVGGRTIGFYSRARLVTRKFYRSIKSRMKDVLEH